MKTLKQILGNDLRQYTMVLALIALLIIFQIWSGGLMITPSNFQSLLSGNAYVLILAIGMVMVIVIGQIDLSVGSVAGFVGMCMALSIRDLGLPWFLGILLGLAMGVVIGCWQGFWLSKVGIPGFITTLAGMMIFRGAVIWISGSISVSITTAPEITFLGAGNLPEWGPDLGMNNSTLLLGIIAIALFGWAEMRKRAKMAKLGMEVPPMWVTGVRFALVAAVLAYLTYIFGTGRPGTSFPVPGLILVLLVVVYHILTQRTTFGRHIYAVGGNKSAAALSGVNTARTYFLVMVNMSFLAAVAGILFVGKSTAAGPGDGTMWELDAIAAVFIGGAAVSGGIGTVIGSMIGGMVMAVLNSGLVLVGIGADKTQIIKGLVLLAAVAFDVYNKSQGRPSIIGRLMSGSKGKKEMSSESITTSGGPVTAADGSAGVGLDIPVDGTELPADRHKEL